MNNSLLLKTSKFWLHAGRVLLFAYAGFVLGVSILGAGMFPEYARAHLDAYTPSDQWSTLQVKAALAELGWPETIPAIVELARNLLQLVVGTSLGLLILWRRPPELFTFFLAFVFISMGAGEALFTPPLQIFPELRSYNEFIGGAAWQFFFIMFFLFPNGKPVPGWSRWLVLTWLVFIVVQSFVESEIFQSWSWFFSLIVLVALASQVYRYFWRSNPVERQQTRWVIAVIFLLMIYIGLFASWGFRSPSDEALGANLVLAFANLLLFNLLIALFPIAVTIAIFRYRLWDIDLVIRRTLVYTVMTALLGLVYLGLVTLLQSIFTGATGQTTPLAIVVSTLAIAVLFNPLRNRVQDFIDRRFFRQRYDAASTVERFSHSLRSQFDPIAIERELADLVSETLQPDSLSLWIQKAKIR